MHLPLNDYRLHPVIAIDAGSVSVKAAVVVPKGLLPAEPNKNWIRFSEASLPDYDLYLSPYCRHRGRATETASTLLREFNELFPDSSSWPAAVTGCLGDQIAGRFDIRLCSQFNAIRSGVLILPENVRTILVLGGENNQYLEVNGAHNGKTSIRVFRTNSECASGTGSFLDEQAKRLGYDIERVGPAAMGAQRAPSVAARCSVFAKSDMIHSQQRGYAPAEVLKGLCAAIVTSVQSAFLDGRPVEPRVALMGGLGQNSAVVDLFRRAWELDEQTLWVPSYGTHWIAIGAALAACEKENHRRATIAQSIKPEPDQVKTALKPLHDARLSALPALDAAVDAPPPEIAFLGIDVGSVTTKLAVIDSDGQLLASIYTRTQGRPIEVVGESLTQIRQKLSPTTTIKALCVTGSGREMIGALTGATTIHDEITCHKVGACYIGRKFYDTEPDTIFDIGGQDAKYIRVEGGAITDFCMNEACAAGTGSFLEERAAELGLPIEQFCNLALSSRHPTQLAERCTVFMSRDVNGYLAQGAELPDLCAGLAYAVVRNYLTRVVKTRPIGQSVFFQGGTAYNQAVVAAFSNVLGKPVIVPPHCGLIGAIGAALLAKAKVSRQSLVGDSAAQGTPQESPAWDGDSQRIAAPRFRRFECHKCENRCEITSLQVDGRQTFWGDRCGSRFGGAPVTGQLPVIQDLGQTYHQLLKAEQAEVESSSPEGVVGIALTMQMYELLPFFLGFFRECGLGVVVTEPTNRKTLEALVGRTIAEPCFPVLAAFGHLEQLRSSPADWWLVPSVCRLPFETTSEIGGICPLGQSFPYMLRTTALTESHARERLLIPRMDFEAPIAVTVDRLCRDLRPLKLSAGQIRRGVHAGFETQCRFREKLLDSGRQALEEIDRNKAQAVVVVGRSYVLHDPAASLSLLSKLHNRFGVNVIPLSFLPAAGAPAAAQEKWDNMYWGYGRRIVRALRFLRNRPDFHLIYVSTFRCGPDSLLRHYLHEAGNPSLYIQMDAHSGDVGLITRCEAYLTSKGVLHSWHHQL
jgi:predicted CoA-substrate-specific enzyme activase